ncbi:MAG TPA: hypothetical protein VGK90_14695 [Rhizomicrobium sp.]|jgi:hypothetical protein
MAEWTQLTGVWLGLYSYPRKLEPVGFTATLIETAGAISGSSHEKPQQGKASGQTIFATLNGHRSGDVVEFVKRYEGGIPHSLAIKYEGTVRDEGAEIEGRWIIPRMWSGRFLMIRSGPKAEAIVRQKYERALI